jgi:histidinol-phosphate aminotransferase
VNESVLTVSERIRSLVPYQPGKPIEEVKRELGITGEIVKLASNENPLGPSPKALEALGAALSHLALYPDGGCHDLRAALAAHWDLSGSAFVFGNGSDEVIHLIGLSLLGEGDEVVVGDPTFVLYEAAARLAGATTIKVPLTRPDFAHDTAAIAAAITDRTRLVFVANPHNPTGSVIDAAGVETLLAALPARGILVLDEAYGEYIEDDPDQPRAVDYIRMGAPVISLRTFSKLYGLAGLRVGYGIADPAIVALLNQPRSPFNVNLAAQAAAVAALGDAEFVARAKRANANGLAQLDAGAAALGLRTVPSRANFVLIDTRRPARPVFDALLRRGVIVRVFPADLPTYLRVTIGTPPQNERFLAALSEALGEIAPCS